MKKFLRKAFSALTDGVLCFAGAGLFLIGVEHIYSKLGTLSSIIILISVVVLSFVLTFRKNKQEDNKDEN